MVWGIVLGLTVGKPLGIIVCAWLACRLGLAQLPNQLSCRQLHGIAWLGGIGFTMSLFIGSLAFRDTQALALAKTAILVGSVISAVAGWLILRGSPARELHHADSGGHHGSG